MSFRPTPQKPVRTSESLPHKVKHDMRLPLRVIDDDHGVQAASHKSILCSQPTRRGKSYSRVLGTRDTIQSRSQER